jgi:predicted Zn-dependent protease
VLAACSTVPYSERTRVVLLPQSVENQMGADAYQQILAEETLSSDPEAVALVERVGRRIAEVTERDHQTGFDWEFVVIDAPDTVNAFCLPGGKVAFYTGILPICKDEDGVAVVMGHEVAHALARHGGERVSQSIVLDLGIAAIAAASSADPGTQETVAAALGVGTAVALVLPFSRKHESEADYIGLMLMAKAGYDPRAAPQFWQRMSAAGDGQPPEFLSTHPSHERRVEDLQDSMPDAMDFYNAATGAAPEYQGLTTK